MLSNFCNAELFWKIKINAKVKICSNRRIAIRFLKVRRWKTDENFIMKLLKTSLILNLIKNVQLKKCCIRLILCVRLVQNVWEKILPPTEKLRWSHCCEISQRAYRLIVHKEIKRWEEAQKCCGESYLSLARPSQTWKKVEFQKKYLIFFNWSFPCSRPKLFRIDNTEFF